jgi:hypothetical protein
MRSDSLSLIVLLMLLLSLTAKGGVVLNEIEISPPSDEVDWVELLNSGGEPVNLSGWKVVLTDGAWKGEIPIQEGLVLMPGEYFVLLGDKRWSNENGAYGLLLNDAGAEVDRSAMVTDSLKNHLTWGRYPDGKDTNRPGEWGFMMGTPGRKNRLGL